MYDENLEQLIDAALEDGVLTEKEKQILFKKAQALGVDLDEFEMVLDARLVKLQKEEKAKAQASAPKSNKFGDIKKCPACGAIVQSYQGVCPECGYAFENVEANSSSQKLQKMLDSILEEQLNADNNSLHNDNPLSSTLKSFSILQAQNEFRKHERIKNAIQNFPVPNTKADLMEFILSLRSKTKGDNAYADAYKNKYLECLDKARFMFPNDKDFAPILAAHKMGWWASKSQRTKTLIILAIFFIIFFSVTLIPMFISH